MDQSTQTFHLFPLLPPELRLLIWQHALLHTPPQILDVYFSNLTFPLGLPVPILLSVCHEARSVALKHYKFLTHFPSECYALGNDEWLPLQLDPGYYFNPSVDIMLFQDVGSYASLNSPRWSRKGEARERRKLEYAGGPMIQNICLNLTAVPNILQHLSYALPGLMQRCPALNCDGTNCMATHSYEPQCGGLAYMYLKGKVFGAMERMFVLPRFTQRKDGDLGAEDLIEVYREEWAGVEGDGGLCMLCGKEDHRWLLEMMRAGYALLEIEDYLQ